MERRANSFILSSHLDTHGMTHGCLYTERKGERERQREKERTYKGSVVRKDMESYIYLYVRVCVYQYLFYICHYKYVNNYKNNHVST